MVQAKAIRVLMALLMATWSPVWCQCVLLAAAQGQANAEICAIDLCDDEWTGDHLADDCCEAQADLVNPVAAVDCCPGECSQSPTDGSCSCACCGRIIVAGSSNASSLERGDADFLGMLDLGIAEVASIPVQHPAQRAEWSQALWRGSGKSLLAQRCLLLI